MSDYKIALNFFPLKEQNIEFKAFGKLALHEQKKPEDVHQYRLYNDLEREKKNYWISFIAKEGYQETVYDHTNASIYLTLKYIYYTLKENCIKYLNSKDFIIPNNFRKGIQFIIKKHSEGNELIHVTPYYLQTKKEFGFLIDYRFNNTTEDFNRKIQQLSLSLDSKFRENKTFYRDKYCKLLPFVKLYYNKVFTKHPHIEFTQELSLLNANR